MSLAATRAVWALKGLPPADKIVLLHIADHCSKDTGGGAFCAQSTIADECGLTVRGVRKILVRLVAAHLIEVETVATHRRTASYRIVVARAEHHSSQERNHVPLRAERHSIQSGTPRPPERNGIPSRAEPRSDDPKILIQDLEPRSLNLRSDDERLGGILASAGVNRRKQGMYFHGAVLEVRDSCLVIVVQRENYPGELQKLFGDALAAKDVRVAVEPERAERRAG
jgi:hypothetical protein